MRNVDAIFNSGPESVIHWFEHEASQERGKVLAVKELADICWTRANSLSRTSTSDAVRWARAALVGYEFLSGCAEPFVAESALENAAALRSWTLLTNAAPV